MISTELNHITLFAGLYYTHHIHHSYVPSCLPSSESCILSPHPAPPHDVLAIFEYELFYGGTVNINIYKERMYGQFPIVSIGNLHHVNSLQSSSQHEEEGLESCGARVFWREEMVSFVPWRLIHE